MAKEAKDLVVSVRGTDIKSAKFNNALTLKAGERLDVAFDSIIPTLTSGKADFAMAGYAVSDNYRVSWLTTESRRIDTKRLKEERPDLYQDYSKVSTCRRFLVKPAA